MSDLVCMALSLIYTLLIYSLALVLRPLQPITFVLFYEPRISTTLIGWGPCLP